MAQKMTQYAIASKARAHFNKKHGTELAHGAFDAHLFGGDHSQHGQMMRHLPDDYEPSRKTLKEHFGLNSRDVSHIEKISEGD